MRARGATLIEVLVVGSLFLALVAAIWMIYHSTVRAQRLITLHSDVDRAVMAGVRHVDASLRSAELVEPHDWTAPEPVESIELRPLKLDEDGDPVVSAEGVPEWGEPFTIVFENGELVRVTDERRVLARLGEDGSVRFIRSSWRMLEMEVKLTREDDRGQKASREMTFQFRLFNQ